MNINYGVLTTKKKGITMVALAITIAVTLILVAAGIVTVSDSIDKATLTSFADDLNTIEDQVDLYYLQNNSFPTEYEDDEALSQGDVLNIVTNDNDFRAELTLNGEPNTSNDSLGAFYQIDMSKINIDKTTRGTGKDGNDDIYVVSASTMRVYYLKGVKVKGAIYYSLSSKIANYSKKEVTGTTDRVSSDVLKAGTLSVEKLKKTWTNKMGITLNAYLNTNETLYLQVSGVTGDRQFLNTKVGNNTYVFNSLNDLATKVTANLTSTEINTFNAKTGQDKYIQIIKKTSSGTAIDTLRVELSNYDITPPSSVSNWSISSIQKSPTRTMEFNVSDTESGIKEVRYDYLKKYNEDGVVENYYEGISTLEGEYIKARGKKASVASDGSVEIKLPEDIEGIAILVLDKADNWSLSLRLVENDFYIGTTLTSLNNAGLGFKVAFNNASGIYDYTMSISTNGTSYTQSVTKTPNVTSRTYSENIYDYVDKVNINDYVYLKIVARDNASSKNDRTIIFKYSLKDAPKNRTMSMVDGVPIPIGFVASEVAGENTKDGGLVIYEGTKPVTSANVDVARTTRNQFVWVPVDDISQFVREDGYPNDYYVESGATSEPYSYNGVAADASEIAEYNEMMASVKKFHGFYIGRYETSPKTTNDEGVTALDCVDVPEVKSGKFSWNWLSHSYSMNDLSSGAVEVSRSLYPNIVNKPKGEVVSTLCYGVQWDATVRWLKNNYPGIEENSSIYGNYSGSTIRTGSNESYKTNNIYDMAGNSAEWTMEAFRDYTRIIRGGGTSYYSGNSRENSISFREEMPTGDLWRFPYSIIY